MVPGFLEPGIIPGYPGNILEPKNLVTVYNSGFCCKNARLSQVYDKFIAILAQIIIRPYNNTIYPRWSYISVYEMHKKTKMESHGISRDVIKKSQDLQVTKILGFFIPGYFRN